MTGGAMLSGRHGIAADLNSHQIGTSLSIVRQLHVTNTFLQSHSFASTINIDQLVKSPKSTFRFIPAKAGVHLFQ